MTAFENPIPEVKNPRISTQKRETAETQIELALNLDGTGVFTADINCGFLTHMLELFTRHGRFDLNIKATGDVHVDYHHLVEDVGITLGKAFSAALGDMRGIVRYGSFLLPMDESLVLAAIDISGRSYLGYGIDLPSSRVGDFDTELVQEFFFGFCRGLPATLHFKQLSGTNTHHIIEAAFKGFGRALKDAVRIDKDFENEIPSTKGLLV